MSSGEKGAEPFWMPQTTLASGRGRMAFRPALGFQDDFELACLVIPALSSPCEFLGFPFRGSGVSLRETPGKPWRSRCAPCLGETGRSQIRDLFRQRRQPVASGGNRAGSARSE